MSRYGFVVLILAAASVSTSPIGLDIMDADEGRNIANSEIFNNDVSKPRNTHRLAYIAEDVRWTSPVPYVFGKDLGLNAKGVVLIAFDEFRVKSCIDFIPRVSEEYYISIRNLNGCYSDIGKVKANGQVLSIGGHCDYLYVVEHEFLHALGFLHEQSRFDRNAYITIVYKNIEKGFEDGFTNVSSKLATTFGIPYDYWSVLHYSKDTFSNGNGPTIITKDPKFQNVIGQTLGMSPSDALELNLFYKCDSTIAFKMYCGFINGTMCHMSRCSLSVNGWEMVTRVQGGPSSDHTNLPSGSNDHGQEAGYFMHASTASGREGDSARLETQVMDLNRECHVQCLQFYYYNSGNISDELNIWIREFEGEQDFTGTLQLMGQITGPPTSHWKLQHVSLHATKKFQVVFEVRKGAGSSTGGFSIDDINLSETECPHVTIQIDEFEKLFNTGDIDPIIYSPRQYSEDGYAYRAAMGLSQTSVGLYVQLLAGDHDNELEWPCLRRQITFKMLDQAPNFQLQMSKQRSFTTDQYSTSYWTNPHKTGNLVAEKNVGLIGAGPLVGLNTFTSLEEMQWRDFLKGGSAIFTFSFQDLTALVNGSTLPCPGMRPVKASHQPTHLDQDPCSKRIATSNITLEPSKNSIFNFSPGMTASPVFTFLTVLKLLHF